MENIIRDIEIPDDRYYIRMENVQEIESQENQVQIIKDLSKINIFIGENNSGKSRFLRSFIINPELLFLPYNPTLSTLNKLISVLKERLMDFSDTMSHNSSMNREIKEHLDEFKEIRVLKNREDPLNFLSDFKSFIENVKRQTNTSVSSVGQTYPEVAESLEIILKNTFEEFNLSHDEIDLKYTFQKIYIPILRGLRPFNNEDVYNNRTENDYFSQGNFEEGVSVDGSRETFTGLNIYNQIKIHLLGRLEQRNLIKEYQDFLSERFFENEEVTLIPDLDEDGILRIKIGDEKEKEIYNLGDGIQSIIIMTFPLFLYRDTEALKDSNLLFFIEEPEHLLHPGLQRKLMDTFHDKRFKDYQFFITTHSNHFLDITLDYDDVSIFYLRKELDDGEGVEKTPYFSIEPLSYGDTNALELLGVRNTSVFLSNCTIWVEGITDRYYIKKYLDVYQDYLKNRVNAFNKANNEKLHFMEFMEDYHYSFVEYAGNNITHWSFLEDETQIEGDEKIFVDRVCGKIFLIADKDDDTKPAKKERHAKLKQKLKNSFCQLPCREVENLLSESVILDTLKDFECGNDLEERNNFSLNLDRNEYVDEPIGKYIEVQFGSIQTKRKYAADSGTLSSNIKLDFCKKAVNHINYENLSDDVKVICDLIYQFISHGNKHDISDYLEISQKFDFDFERIDFDSPN